MMAILALYIYFNSFKDYDNKATLCFHAAIVSAERYGSVQY